jgi:hypothetical protein
LQVEGGTRQGLRMPGAQRGCAVGEGEMGELLKNGGERTRFYTWERASAGLADEACSDTIPDVEWAVRAVMGSLQWVR